MKRLTWETMTDEQRWAIRNYARQHGRCWKAKLRVDWMRAALVGPLHQLRNHSAFGPIGLINFRLPPQGPQEITDDVVYKRIREALCVHHGAEARGIIATYQARILKAAGNDARNVIYREMLDALGDRRPVGGGT